MTARPRIMLVNYEYPPLGGGAGTATAGMARALVGLGCDVTVLTSRFRGQPEVEIADGFTIRRVRVVRRHADRCSPAEMMTFIVSAAADVVRPTERPRPDLTIAFFGVPGGPVAWVLRLRRGTPYIISLRGGDVPGFKWAPGTGLYHLLSAPAIRFLWRRAAAVIANGAGLRQLAERAAPGLSVPVVPNGVDTVLHAPDPAAEKASMAGPPEILLVGRLVHQKGADILLHALGMIRDLDFSVRIVGDGPDRHALERLAEEQNIAGRVAFTGWVPRENIADHYRRADIFAFPSRIEGMPNVVLEAMAYALPVVATDVDGNRDVLANGRTGLLVPTEDPALLAAALRRVLTEPSLRRRLGGAARAHVVHHHTWAASARSYLELGGVTIPPTASPADRTA
jgi:glycosyltransferase involved in cell wall biosynthesis